MEILILILMAFMAGALAGAILTILILAAGGNDDDHD